MGLLSALESSLPRSSGTRALGLQTLLDRDLRGFAAPSLFLVFVLFSLYWVIPLLHNLFVSPSRNVPGPFWARVTRWYEYFAVLQGDSNQLYRRLHDKYGPVVRIGPYRYSFTRPEDVKVIYELGGKYLKSAYYNPLNPPIREQQNIFAIRDNDWHKEKRRKVAALYSMTSVVSYEEPVDKMTSVCLRKMREFADAGQLVSIPNFMQYYAFDVIGMITFDQSFGMMEHGGDTTGMIEGIRGVNDYLGHMGVTYNLHPWNAWLRSLLRLPIKGGVLAQYCFTQIAKHRAQPSATTLTKKTNYETFLAKLLRMEAEKKVAATNMIDTCGSNIGAGSDTTAISLSAALFYLYANPEKISKLRHEIETGSAEGRISNPVTFQEAQNMPFLQAVIKETLRLHPAVGTILARDVPRGGAQLGGYYFPEGAEVGCNAWVLHYNKDIYGPDAEVYRPERWLEADKSSLKDSMMFAFGAGSRTCIGKNISLLEMTKLLPQIVRDFDIELEGHSPYLNTTCAWFVYPRYKARVTLRNSK
ncbi:uncharacterized protein A1O9_00879 [Exophiala aquamarina CBS 119918]|uniref:Cytochrome P450 oxidoreductase n=1 Tax=Exophiala aquamarina CBS 119918 TaxID=1182545 RepID=A0A072Q4S1_9EURO|nr:uncharacterized protein A1O9_00879 [Exophiala aquamarina CBS 119918]KEF62905.1 hypothetical protein A1O9_00879 [Exophiala aquamarina CBS 119918]